MKSDILISSQKREAIKSKLFKALNDQGVLKEDHADGCILFEKRDIVEGLL